MAAFNFLHVLGKTNNLEIVLTKTFTMKQSLSIKQLDE